MSDARDKARGQTSRSRTQRAQRTVSRGAQRNLGGGNKATSNANQINQNIKNQQDQNKDKPKQHKVLTGLKNLQAKGQGNTQAAKVLEDYLAGVVSPEDKSGDKTPFEKKQTIYDDFISSQVADYKPNLEPREITLADGTKMMTYGSFEPGQFFGNQYSTEEGQPYSNLGEGSPFNEAYIDPITGRERYETRYSASPLMDFGFGSVFGTSSGSTGSSQAVQQSLETMMDDLHAQGYSPGAASAIAMEKMYPGYDKYMKDDGKIPVNYMGIPEGRTSIADKWKERMATGIGGGPSGGGFSGWPGGGGGGGAGGGGGYYGPQPGYTPKQMAGFYTPQANLQQAMINVHQTPTVFKKRGGIVSLLELS